MKFETVRRHCLSLPDATEAPHHHYTSFRVAGRIFATVPPERNVVHIMLGEPEREQALALHPGFIEKLFWGDKVVGLRVHLAEAKPAVIRNLLAEAHAAKTTRRPGRAQSRRTD